MCLLFVELFDSFVLVVLCYFPDFSLRDICIYVYFQLVEGLQYLMHQKQVKAEMRMNKGQMT